MLQITVIQCNPHCKQLKMFILFQGDILRLSLVCGIYYTVIINRFKITLHWKIQIVKWEKYNGPIK